MTTKKTDVIDDIVEERKQSKDLARQAFDTSITDEGIKKLKKRYPSKLVVNMKDETEFKSARKIKTERNVLTKNINDRRIAFNKDIKAIGDNLIVDVEKIYSVIIKPFETEEKWRKDEARRAEDEKQAELAKQSLKILGIKEFVQLSVGKDSNYIQASIESVDLIEPEVFHQDLIHEVIEVKRDTLTALTINLNDAIAREKLEEERLKLNKEREEMQAKQAKIDRDAKIEAKINNLKMIPVNFFEKTSIEIREKINALSDFTATEEMFNGRADEVTGHISGVIKQLTSMEGMKLFEENQAAAEKKKEMIKNTMTTSIKKAESELSKVTTEKRVIDGEDLSPVVKAIVIGDNVFIGDDEESSYTPMKIISQGAITVEEIPLTEKTTKTVRGALTKYCESNGYGSEDASLIEALLECGEEVYADPDIEMHRWYGLQTVVNEIEGVFIMFNSYIITGDSGMSDMDLSYNLDEMSIVQRKERTVIEVYYE